MTRTYRMYVDTGISDRLMNFLKYELPVKIGYTNGRFKATNFSRGSNNNSYFDFELLAVAAGFSLWDYTPGDPVGLEIYYETYTGAIQNEVIFNQLKAELIFDSGNPRMSQTHQYHILQIITNTKTHKYDIEIV